MKNKEPKVSIVIPCWNAESYISHSISSCIEQKYPNVEIIVVNDGSTDRSEEVIESFGNRIASIHVENGGAPKARNTGLLAATGQYVMFLDADDYIEGEMISSLVYEMIATDAELGFASWVKVRDGIDISPIHVQKVQSWRDMLISWLLGKYTPPCAVIWNKRLLSKIGGWDEQLIKNQDGDLVLRGLLEKPILAFTNVGRGVYRQHDSPFRVSGAGTIKNHQASSIIFEKLISSSETDADHEIKKSVGLYAYGFASFMYANGQPHLGDIWRKRAKKMGVLNASNTTLGLLLGRLFGLKYKTYIAVRVANLKLAFRYFRVKK